jgi:hypothetical protein
MHDAPFSRPRFVITNICTKAVRVFGLLTIQPKETLDVYDTLDPTELPEDLITKSLEYPWGDLYNEVVLKKTLRIDDIYLSVSRNITVSPRNINSSNEYSSGTTLTPAGDQFVWAPVTTSLTAEHPLVINTDVISIPVADSTHDGYLSKEDYILFSGSLANTHLPIKIWQYQDFDSPVSTSLSISEFANGDSFVFNASYIISNTATIVLRDDTESIPSTSISVPGKWLVSNRVNVSSQIGTTVILDQAPHSSLNCRVYFLIGIPNGISIPSNYQEAPAFIKKGQADNMDSGYVNIAGDETIYGLKTFDDDVSVLGKVSTETFSMSTGAVDGYVLTSDPVGNASWQTVENLNTFVMGGARNHTRASNIYLRTYDGATTLVAPLVIPFDCTLVAMSASSESLSSWNAEVHVSNVLVPGASLAVTASDSAYANKNVNFLAGSRLQLYCNGVNVPFPRINLFLRRVI